MRLPFVNCVLVVICFAVAACSGAKGGGGGCVTNCSGQATMSLVLTATPSAPTSQLSIQAFTVGISGVSLTPSSGGNAVAVNLTSSSYVAEFNRVSSDSTLLASQVSVPAGTYSQMVVTLTAPRVTYCKQPNPGVAGCASATLTSITGAAGSVTISGPFTVTANQLNAFVINADLPAALTISGQTIASVDMEASNTLSVTSLPAVSGKTDLGSGQLAHVDDVLGLVTNVTSSSITVMTATRGSITAKANSSTQFGTGCSVQSLACVSTNEAAIVDTVMNSDGSLTLTFVQPASTSAVDLIEGVVTSVPSTVTNQFTLVATDSVAKPSGSVLTGQLNVGDQMVVTLGGTVVPFVIANKGLTVPANSFSGAASVSAIQPGMTVAFPVTAYVAQSGSTPGSTTASTFALRFTRVTALMGAPGTPLFTANTFPPYFGIPSNQQFQVTSGRLSLDGVSTLNGVPVGNSITASALFLGSTGGIEFAAQSVRAH
jgi:hypothetical protein